jgi:hypothetical protein
MNCDLDISDLVARDGYQESHRAIRIGGVGVRERGILRSAHGTRLRADTARALSGIWSAIPGT